MENKIFSLSEAKLCGSSHLQQYPSNLSLSVFVFYFITLTQINYSSFPPDLEMFICWFNISKTWLNIFKNICLARDSFYKTKLDCHSMLTWYSKFGKLVFISTLELFSNITNTSIYQFGSLWKLSTKNLDCVNEKQLTIEKIWRVIGLFLLDWLD